MNKESLYYYFVRCITYPIGFLPLRWIHFLGKIIGTFSYYFLRDYRKTALSNLALASHLSLSNQQIISFCKQSFQNLAINVLEYPFFDRVKNYADIIHCNNPSVAQELYSHHQGIIFFCGHLANWEVLFLDGNRRMQGIAIGKPIKNKELYRWIVSIRERTGGKMIVPQNALKEGLNALKKGIFVGIVGDQGMPQSHYSYPFLGRTAWTSTAPALLAYRTNSPIIVATAQREEAKYSITYSDPIYPCLDRPVEKEIIRLMDTSLAFLEKAIKKNPGQWLWQHNRWKQYVPDKIFKALRKEAICIILPQDPAFFQYYLCLSLFRNIYHKSFISLFVPENFSHFDFSLFEEIIPYNTEKELLKEDFRWQLIFNFTNYRPIKRHYLQKSAYKVLTMDDLKKIAKKNAQRDPCNFSETITLAVCKPNTSNKGALCL
ncbi:MAG: hypothetical protein JW769_02665 [Parachlamydiales bacterium]|nr:hypothetical protein [Parachlamydiales bacterium]